MGGPVGILGFRGGGTPTVGFWAYRRWGGWGKFCNEGLLEKGKINNHQRIKSN